jgi:ABC-type polysaccharide/polyol phosphate export permease
MAPMILKLNPFYYIAAGYRDRIVEIHEEGEGWEI